MMNMTRGEEFTVELSLDTEPEELESLEVNVVQGGAPLLRREMAEAETGAEARQLCFVFTGEETRRLRAGLPAFIQARGTAHSGTVRKSAVEELNVLDALGMKEERAWN